MPCRGPDGLPAPGAAAVTLIIGGAGYALSGPGLPAPAFMAREFVTGPGETRRSISRMGAPCGWRNRADSGRSDRPAGSLVDGTAFFVVAKQAGARFVVRTNAGSATVLGTRFEMKTTDDRVRVVVVEGTVVVANHQGDQVKLDAGQMTFAGPEQPPSVSRVPDPHRLVDWGGQVLLFQDTPLRQVGGPRNPIQVRYDHPDRRFRARGTPPQRHLARSTGGAVALDDLPGSCGCAMLDCERHGVDRPLGTKDR